MAKGFLSAIKEYGNIKAEQSKIKADMLANEFKAKQNYFYQQKEKDADLERQKQLLREYSGMGGQAATAEDEEMGAAPYGGMVPSTAKVGGLTFRNPQAQRMKQALEDKILQGEATPEEISRYRSLFGKKGQSIDSGSAVTKPPIKQVGFFDPRRALPDFANYNDSTKKVIANIKVQADIDELLQNRAEYEDAGVDVMAIADYYTK
jgi:hypothetical protein